MIAQLRQNRQDVHQDFTVLMAQAYQKLVLQVHSLEHTETLSPKIVATVLQGSTAQELVLISPQMTVMQVIIVQGVSSRLHLQDWNVRLVTIVHKEVPCHVVVEMGNTKICHNKILVRLVQRVITATTLLLLS